MKRAILSTVGIIIFLMLLACGSNKQLTVQEKRSPQELIKAGDQLYARGDYKDALETYNRILIFYPTSDLDIDAKLRIAKCYSKMEKYEKQMKVLLQLLKENLIPEYVPAIYIQIGEYYETAARFNPENSNGDSVDYQTAIDYYNKAIHYEDSNNKEAKIEAMYRKALVEAKLGKDELAAKEYQDIIDTYPDSPFAILAQIKLLNPKDTGELSTYSDSLAVYKKRLAEAGITLPEKGKTIQPQAAPPTKTQSFEDYLNQNPVDTTQVETPQEQMPQTPAAADSGATLTPTEPDTTGQ